MVQPGTLIAAVFPLWAVVMTVLYYREQEYRRDVLTDMMQLVHDYDVAYDELRRSHGYDEVDSYFDKE